MATIATTDDGYVTDEPAIYDAYALGAGVLPGGGPFTGENNYAWLLFENVCEQGNLISSAILQLYAHDFGGNAPSEFNTSPVLIRAFAEASPTVPTSYADFLSRDKTTAQLVTSLPVNAQSELATANVSAILQELADEPGFNGDVVLTIEVHGTSDGIAAWESIESGTEAQLVVFVNSLLPTAFAKLPANNGHLTMPANSGHLVMPTNKGHLTIPDQR